jgi:dephospho-CoA kinase
MKNTKKTKSPKLLVVGNARHGKDTFAEILSQQFGMTFESSSQAASNIFIYDLLKEKYDYKTPEDCFEDRFNHRQEWYEAICDYNKSDKSKLAKGILERADCYVGMRDCVEIEECLRQNLFDIVIWVDASKRLPMEDASSFNIDKSCADIVVENNDTLNDFFEKVMRIGKLIFKNNKQ